MQILVQRNQVAVDWTGPLCTMYDEEEDCGIGIGSISLETGHKQGTSWTLCTVPFKVAGMGAICNNRTKN